MVPWKSKWPIPWSGFPLFLLIGVPLLLSSPEKAMAKAIEGQTSSTDPLALILGNNNPLAGLAGMFSNWHDVSHDPKLKTNKKAKGETEVESQVEQGSADKDEQVDGDLMASGGTSSGRAIQLLPGLNLDWDLVNRIGMGMLKSALPAIISEMIPRVVPALIRGFVDFARQARASMIQFFRISPETVPAGLLDNADVEGMVASGVNIARAAFSGAVAEATPPPPRPPPQPANPLGNLLSMENVGGLLSNVLSGVVTQSLGRLASGNNNAPAAGGADGLSSILNLVGGLIAPKAG